MDAILHHAEPADQSASLRRPLLGALLAVGIHVGLMMALGFLFGFARGFLGALDIPVPDWIDGITVVLAGGISIVIVMHFLDPGTVAADLGRKHSRRDWILAAFFALLTYFVSVFAAVMLSSLPFMPQESEAELLLEMFPQPIVLRLLLMAVFIPIIEEIIYRGVVLVRLTHRFRPGFAILISAALFGIIHFDPFQAVYAFFVGLFIGWFYLRTRSLMLAIWIHAVFNSYGLLMSELQLEQYGESFVGVYAIVFLLMVGVGGGTAIRHFTREYAWPDYTKQTPTVDSSSHLS